VARILREDMKLLRYGRIKQRHAKSGKGKLFSAPVPARCIRWERGENKLEGVKTGHHIMTRLLKER